MILLSMVILVKGYYCNKNIQKTEHYKAIWWFRPSSMDLRLFSHDFLPDIQLFTYDIITLFHWFLVVQHFCNSAIFDFFDVFENCGLTEIFKVEKSGLNQKEKESSLLTFLESHRGWEIIIKMVLKNSVLWIVFVLFVIFVFHARPYNFF